MCDAYIQYGLNPKRKCHKACSDGKYGWWLVSNAVH
jgi:hypothetical protein